MYLVFYLFFFFLTFAEEKWAIIANAPPVPNELIIKSIQGCKVMALDGAADQIRKCGLYPDVILGDFDSIENKEYWGIVDINDDEDPYMGYFGVLIVPAKDQNYTDLEKGISYCDAHGAVSILILNATDGLMDHTLGNIGFLRKYYNCKRPILIQTMTERIEYLRDGCTTIFGEVGAQCAVMAYPEATMTSRGLKYNGVNYPLTLGLQESVCNTLAAKEAQVMIHGEAIVIHPLNDGIE